MAGEGGAAGLSVLAYASFGKDAEKTGKAQGEKLLEAQKEIEKGNNTPQPPPKTGDLDRDVDRALENPSIRADELVPFFRFK